MSHITLIRHGQANSAARDEAGYDMLSPLGHQQSQWLGDHLRASHNHHPRVYCGTLRRHVETAAGMGFEAEHDARLNELSYFQMAKLLEEQHGVPVPTDSEGYIRHLPQIFEEWRLGRIEGVPEPYDEFQARIQAALHEISQGDGPALVVTSGGLIAMVMGHLMGLETRATARLALAIMNTSMHRLFPIGGTLSPVMFNAVPHLETPDRHFAQTHI